MNYKVCTPLLYNISKYPQCIDVSLGNLKIKLGVLRLKAGRYCGVIWNLVLDGNMVCQLFLVEAILGPHTQNQGWWPDVIDAEQHFVNWAEGKSARQLRVGRILITHPWGRHRYNQVVLRGDQPKHLEGSQIRHLEISLRLEQRIMGKLHTPWIDDTHPNEVAAVSVLAQSFASYILSCNTYKLVRHKSRLHIVTPFSISKSLSNIKYLFFGKHILFVYLLKLRSLTG